MKKGLFDEPGRKMGERIVRFLMIEVPQEKI
jgi:hypothetical protein